MMEKRKINKVGIIGSGKLGTDIFYYLLSFNFHLVWKCIDDEEAERCKNSFQKKIARQMKCGLIDETTCVEIQQLVYINASNESLADCDFVIEAIWEDELLKKELFEAILPLVKDDCIIVSNTSSINPSKLIVSNKIKSKFVGLHFFYPTALKNIVEIIRTDDASKETMDRVLDFCKTTQKEVLVLDEINSFILNKLFLEVQNEACSILNDRILSYKQIDDLVSNNLFPGGIFSFFDHVGNDIMLKSVRNYAAQSSEPNKYIGMIELLEGKVAKNLLGVKTKVGFYDYSDTNAKHNSQPTDESEAIIIDSILLSLKSAYIGKAIEIVASGVCSKEMLEYAAKEYTGADKGPFAIGLEINKGKYKIMERVVVTGMSLITSLGLTLEENWTNLVAGKSGVSKITLFDAAECETQIAAEIPTSFEDLWPKYVKKRSADQMTRITKACFVCAKEAVNQSGINFEEQDKSRCAVILGVVTTANTSSEKNPQLQTRILKSMNNAMSAWISLEYKLEGPNFTVASACASSAYAIGLGYDMIRSGVSDVVIVGGADSIVNKEEIEGFNHLYALSTENAMPEKASKPFSKNRDGFVIGEGAGVLILESETSAKARNASVLAEIAGYAITSEAYNIMAPMKDGAGIAQTIAKALKNAQTDITQVDYINAHGTSTMLNDKYETLAIKKVFGERAYGIPISSSKSMIGHTIGAAGAIELIITIQSINKGIVTPTINLDEPDPELDLDYVPNVARNHTVNCALSNSFAFGGHNAVLVVKKYL